MRNAELLTYAERVQREEAELAYMLSKYHNAVQTAQAYENAIRALIHWIKPL